MDKIYRMANREGGSRRHEATKENPHFAIHNPKFGQNEQNYQNGDRVRPMLRLANQSSSFAASELARCWVSDCLIRYANAPPAGIIAIAKFALRTPLSSLPRRIPARRNEQAKNKTSSSLLGRVLLFYACSIRTAKA
jgi:hypothetical protein